LRVRWDDSEDVLGAGSYAAEAAVLLCFLVKQGLKSRSAATGYTDRWQEPWDFGDEIDRYTRVKKTRRPSYYMIAYTCAVRQMCYSLRSIISVLIVCSRLSLWGEVLAIMYFYSSMVISTSYMS
jgi:hypothetical protein